MNSNMSNVGKKPKKLQIKQSALIGGNKKDHLFTELLGGESPPLQSDYVAGNSKSIIGTGTTDADKQPANGSNKSAKEPSKELHEERTSSIESSTSPERSQKNDSIKSKISIYGDNRPSLHNETFKSTSENRTSSVLTHDSTPPSSTRRRRSPQRIPYFINEVRERDRLRRKYGIVSNKQPPSSASSRSRRSRSTSRSRYHSSNRERTHRHRSKSRPRYARDISGRDREKSRSNQSRERTPNYRHRSEDRERSRHRRRSFHSYSRSRSPSVERVARSRTESSRNERHKYRHGEHDEASNANLVQRNVAQTQIITIPVPVPADFLNYSYPAWPPTQWNPHLAQPSRYGTRTAYPPILPATVIPHMRPPFPPYGLPHPSIHYGGRSFRFPPHYGVSRPWQRNFRGRNT